MYYKTLSAVWPKPKPYTLEIGASAAVKRPELAVIIAGIIAISADIENIKAQMMVGLLKGEPKVAVPMFMTLRSLKDNALRTAAEANLSRAQYRLFSEALDCGAKFEIQRNFFAHWPWAYCPELPNHFCLVDPTSIPSAHASIQQITNSAKDTPLDFEYVKKKMRKQGEKMRTQTRTYDRESLAEIANLGAASKSLLQELSWYIMFPDEVREEKFAQLEDAIQRFPKQGKNGEQDTQASH